MLRSGETEFRYRRTRQPLEAEAGARSALSRRASVEQVDEVGHRREAGNQQGDAALDSDGEGAAVARAA